MFNKISLVSLLMTIMTSTVAQAISYEDLKEPKTFSFSVSGLNLNGYGDAFDGGREHYYAVISVCGTNVSERLQTANAIIEDEICEELKKTSTRRVNRGLYSSTETINFEQPLIFAITADEIVDLVENNNDLEDTSFKYFKVVTFENDFGREDEIGLSRIDFQAIQTGVPYEHLGRTLMHIVLE